MFLNSPWIGRLPGSRGILIYHPLASSASSKMPPLNQCAVPLKHQPSGKNLSFFFTSVSSNWRISSESLSFISSHFATIFSLFSVIGLLLYCFNLTCRFFVLPFWIIHASLGWIFCKNVSEILFCERCLTDSKDEPKRKSWVLVVTTQLESCDSKGSGGNCQFSSPTA